MLKHLSVFSGAVKNDAQLRRSLSSNLAWFLKLAISNKLNRKFSDIIIINLTEHIGDLVACEPIAAHVRKRFPKAYIIWSVDKKYAELVRYNPNVNSVMELSCLTEWILIKKIASRFARIYDCHIDSKRCSKHRISSRNTGNKQLNFDNYLNYGNLLKVATMAAGLEDISTESPRFHFKPGIETKKFVSGKYIVVHTQANDPERNWTNDKWNELFCELVTKYPDVKIVEVGLTNLIHTDDPRYINLTAKLDFQEIASLIKYSKLFIGVESGFAHIANSLRKSSIVLIGYFQQYKKYMVYSGAFTNPSVATLLYHEGPVQDLPVVKVLDEVERILRLKTIQVLNKEFQPPLEIVVPEIPLREVQNSLSIKSFG